MMNPSSSTLMEPDEKWRRYQMMRREAASELQLYMHAGNDADDVVDRFELATLWRLAYEGQEFSGNTWEQMLEATNQ